MIITQEIVLDRLTYDPDTGIFVWRKAYRKKDIGRVSGWINTDNTENNFTHYKLLPEDPD